MIVKSLIIASIIFNSLGLNSLSAKFDQAVSRNEYGSLTSAVASNQDLRLPDIFPRPAVKEDAIPPKIYAKNYILVDETSGKILLKQAHKDQVPIASTTKIMTAIVALENYKLDDIVTISNSAANQIGATANFRVGEKLTVHNLLKAMLIKSANGAAYALAEHMNDQDKNGKIDASSINQNTNTDNITSPPATPNVSTDQDEESIPAGAQDVINPTEKPKVAKFIAAMNAKAKDLGMNNTNYHDPAGLDVTGYSSAYDLYIATKYALQKDIFADIVKTDHDTIKDVTGTIWHDLKNSNRLVGEYNYPGAIGVKTGYMPEAGHVLVSAATRDGHTLIGVVINTFADTAPASADESKKLLDWGFANTEW